MCGVNVVPMFKLCAPGTFGSACEYSAATLFGSHRVYVNVNASRHGGARSDNSDAAEFSERMLQEVVRSLKMEDGASSSPVRLIVDVGVWKGHLALHLAAALKAQLGGGTLLAVDTFAGGLDFWTSGGKNVHQMHFVNGMPQVLGHFLSNVVRSNLSAFVVPFPVSSRIASQFCQARSVYADGVHLDHCRELKHSTAHLDVREDLDMW